MTAIILRGDARALPLPNASVDAIVCDPPYGLEFMGEDWDSFRPSSARIRTHADGRTNGAAGRAVTSTPEAYVAGLPFQQWCTTWAREALRVLKPGGYLLAFGGTRTAHRLTCGIEDAGFEIRDSIAWLYGQGFPKSHDVSKALGETDRRQGLGTALKPANEPITLARKPFAGTIAANVMEHGTGALNIDACRIPASDKAKFPEGYSKATGAVYAQDTYSKTWLAGPDSNPGSRWPTNVVLDDTIAGELDEQTGTLTSGANPTRRHSDKFQNAYGDFKGQSECEPARGADSGGASRFFPVFRYEAKAPANERPEVDGVTHPTPKPLDLMRWLVRLITPPGGLVLDTHAGSGATLEAALLEGFDVIGVELAAKYLPLIRHRVDRARRRQQPGINRLLGAKPPKQIQDQLSFDLTGSAT